MVEGVKLVEGRGRQLDVVWDDGLVLHTQLRRRGTWDLYRDGEKWRGTFNQVCAEIHTDNWIAVCFGAAVVETYRRYDRSRHPGVGPLGADVCRTDADLDESINRLYHYHDQQAPIAEALLDEHVVRSLGNVYRCESLWASRLHPFAPVASLDGPECAGLVEVAARLVRAHVHGGGIVPTGFVPGFVPGAVPAGTVQIGFVPAGFGVPGVVTATGADLEAYGRNGQPCRRCGDTIHVCRSGEHAQLLYWCPGCQVRHSPFNAVVAHVPGSRPMDPHPAAAQYLSDLPWRRNERRAG